MYALLVPAWRWVFYLGAPAAIIALVWCWAALAGWERRHAPGRIDVLGAALVTTALAAGLVCLSTIGEPDAPGALSVSLIAGAACVAAAAGAVIHARRTDDPFLDPRLFRDRVFRGAVLRQSAHGICPRDRHRGIGRVGRPRPLRRSI